MEPKRILLVISSLGAGGAERVASTLANGWVARGRDVSVITLAPAGARPFYPLDPRVAVLGLGLAFTSRTLAQTLVATARRVAALRRAIRRAAPDVVVSFLDSTNVLVLLATRGLGRPVVVAERSSARNVETRRLTRAARAAAYRLASSILVQTEAARRELPAVLRSKARVIPNAVAPPDPIAAGDPIPVADGGRVITVARLVPAKGVDLLIEAFALVARQCPGATLTIVGDGPERPALEARRDRQGLGARVVFAGLVADPRPWLRRAAVFALASRYEGFPNALCEAMAHGLPAVAFDVPCGPAEIIREGVDGLLVPAGDVAALADAIVGLIRDPARRARLARRAPEICDRFSADRVAAGWEEVLAAAVGRRRAPVSGQIPGR